jgi:hypothetical protein
MVLTKNIKTSCLTFLVLVHNVHNEKENLSHSPSSAETFRNDSKYRLPDDRVVVLCHSVISFSQHVLCARIKFFNEVRMLNLKNLCSLQNTSCCHLICNASWH